jgi:folate-dependent phosphoribosylglycinamide formyltransferase PurN
MWVRVAIRPDDTPETFEARMHDAEREIIVEAIGRCIKQA